MIFNGHTPESIASLDDVTMYQMQTMYADGLLGNQAIIAGIGKLTAGVFNYIRPATAPAYKLQDTIGPVYDYIYPPETEVQKVEAVNHNLLSFLSQAPGFNASAFGVTNG